MRKHKGRKGLENEYGSKKTNNFKLISNMSEYQLMQEKSSVEEKLEKLAKVTSGKWFNQAYQLRQQLRLRLRMINKYLYPDLYTNSLLNLDKVKEKMKIKMQSPDFEKPVKPLRTKETLEDLIKARQNMQIKLKQLKNNIRKDTRPENVQKMTLKLKSGLKTLDSRINKEKKRMANPVPAMEEVTAEQLLEMEEDIESAPNFTKPLYNQHGKLVYSKFDLENPIKDTLETNKRKNLKASLQKVLKEKEEINQLRREGKVSEAVEQLNNSLWKNSMARIAGQKVKDDPTKIRDSIKQTQTSKKKSAVQWVQREQLVANKQRQAEERKKRNKEFRNKKRNEKKTRKPGNRR